MIAWSRAHRAWPSSGLAPESSSTSAPATKARSPEPVRIRPRYSRSTRLEGVVQFRHHTVAERVQLLRAMDRDLDETGRMRIEKDLGVGHEGNSSGRARYAAV